MIKRGLARQYVGLSAGVVVRWVDELGMLA
jgi:hypothetical protein